MPSNRLTVGRCLLTICTLAVAGLHFPMPVGAAEPFPFDRTLLLDAAPMRPGKRMPALTVESNGSAVLDLWCRSVAARIDINEAAMRIEAAPLTEDLPAMQSGGQCTPERIRADEDLYVTLIQVTGWRAEGGSVVLEGATPLKFRPATN